MSRPVDPAYARRYMRAHQLALTELHKRHPKDWKVLLAQKKREDPKDGPLPAHEYELWYGRIYQRTRHALARLHRTEFTEIRRLKRRELEAQA
jgi:hypothetical protein